MSEDINQIVKDYVDKYHEKTNLLPKMNEIPSYNYEIPSYNNKIPSYNNEIPSNNLEEFVKKMIRDLQQSRNQLTDLRKIKFGYNLTDSVIDVGEGEYGISYGDDFLYTYGIEPCCGVVLCDGDKSILFHLYGRSSPEDVKKVTDSLMFDNSSSVLICPGVTCEIPGSFQYQELAQLYRNLGYVVTIQRIGCTLGYVKVEGTQVRVGSAILNDETIFDLKPKGLRK